jgi:hypothetical protein
VVFSLRLLNKKKRNSEKHTEIFLEFLVFLKQANKKKKNEKQEKLFTRENSQQAKEETRNLFGFSSTTITN